MDIKLYFSFSLKSENVDIIYLEKVLGHHLDHITFQ